MQRKHLIPIGAVPTPVASTAAIGNGRQRLFEFLHSRLRGFFNCSDSGDRRLPLAIFRLLLMDIQT